MSSLVAGIVVANIVAFPRSKEHFPVKLIWVLWRGRCIGSLSLKETETESQQQTGVDLTVGDGIGHGSSMVSAASTVQNANSRQTARKRDGVGMGVEMGTLGGPSDAESPKWGLKPGVHFWPQQDHAVSHHWLAGIEANINGILLKNPSKMLGAAVSLQNNKP